MTAHVLSTLPAAAAQWLWRGAPALLLASLQAHAAAPAYTLESLAAPFPEFVASGQAVTMRATGPSADALRRVAVLVNGRDVTARFAPDGNGALVGTVDGLAPGPNRFELRPLRNGTAVAARATVSTAVAPQLPCASLTNLQIPPSMLDAPADVVEITLAEAVAATSTLPSHCRIRGRVNPRIGINGVAFAIGFELRLPDAWSGRFFFQGGGGNDGSIGSAVGNPGFGGAPALARGMAAVLTDGGHTGTSAADFGFDPQARIDHAYNAYGKTAATAKAIVDLVYGRRPDRSYFAGCSGGGRQGMMFTQRYPTAFDGVIATAPAMRVATGASISSAWESITYRSIAPAGGDGLPVLSQAFSDGDLKLVADAVVAQCDALDGLADGSINHAAACRFDPAVLQCTGAKTASCLAPAQVGALKQGFGGPRNSAGVALYFPWPYDAGVSAPGWRAWKLGTSTTGVPNSLFSTLIQDAMRNEFFTPPDPAFSIFEFDFDTDPARMSAFGSLYDTWADVTLGGFRANGGKLMLLNGLSDPIFSALETVDYQQRLNRANGAAAAADFSRLFLVPGMNHCGGGPATTTFDTLTRMLRWVEDGEAPTRIVASGSAFPGRTRPLCPYPSYARYDGSGDPENAASFRCTAPGPLR